MSDIADTRAQQNLLRKSEADPAWIQIIKLFQRHGMTEPPARLRDELVTAFSCAWEAAETITSLRRELAESHAAHGDCIKRNIAMTGKLAEAREKALEGAARWHDGMASVYARQIYDAYGKEGFHRESAASIRALKQPEEGDGG